MDHVVTIATSPTASDNNVNQKEVLTLDSDVLLENHRTFSKFSNIWEAVAQW